MVAGDAFGDENCVRLSYAASEQELIRAMSQIKDALAKFETN
jgi:aspartate aminotransferase